jgi:hypothetical protein
MDMTRRYKQALAVALVLSNVSTATSQEPESVTDPQAYVLWGLLVPFVWNNRTRDPILLQRETETTHFGCGDPEAPSRAWRSAVDSFRRQNKRVQLLQPLLPKDVRYRFISRAEIEADDARLAIKYPGSWQRRPESLEFAAVSAIGFNGNKSKAILYVRRRDSGGIYFMEKRDGKWVHAPTLSRCGWIA